MKDRLLLPHIFRKVGFAMLLPSIAWLLASYVFNHPPFPFLQFNTDATGKKDFFDSDFIFERGFTTDFNGEISLLLTWASLFMIAFAREKKEDEYVKTVRLRALQVSIYINYGVVALASIFIYGLSFMWVMYAALFSMLIIFILIYYYQLHLRPRLVNNS